MQGFDGRSSVKDRLVTEAVRRWEQRDRRRDRQTGGWLERIDHGCQHDLSKIRKPGLGLVYTIAITNIFNVERSSAYLSASVPGHLTTKSYKLVVRNRAATILIERIKNHVSRAFMTKLLTKHTQLVSVNRSVLI